MKVYFCSNFIPKNLGKEQSERLQEFLNVSGFNNPLVIVDKEYIDENTICYYSKHSPLDLTLKEVLKSKAKIIESTHSDRVLRYYYCILRGYNIDKDGMFEMIESAHEIYTGSLISTVEQAFKLFDCLKFIAKTWSKPLPRTKEYDDLVYKLINKATRELNENLHTLPSDIRKQFRPS